MVLARTVVHKLTLFSVKKSLFVEKKILYDHLRRRLRYIRMNETFIFKAAKKILRTKDTKLALLFFIEMYSVCVQNYQ